MIKKSRRLISQALALRARRRKRRIKAFLLWVVLLVLFTVLAVLAATYELAFVEPGSRLVVEKALQHLPAHKTEYGRIEGTIAEGITIRNLNLMNVSDLLPGNEVRIQELFASLNSWDPRDLTLRINNARLLLPLSEPFVFQGEYRDRKLHFNFFTKSMDIQDVRTVLQTTNLRSFQGNFTNVDLFLQGGYGDPRVEGSLRVVQIANKTFRLMNSDVSLRIPVNIVRGRKSWWSTGTILVHNGQLRFRGIVLDLLPSSIQFTDGFSNPGLNIRGTTKVKQTTITVAVEGTKKEPRLELSSVPSRPREELLLMLATGKNWSSTQEMVEDDSSSGELAADMVDFFLLGTTGYSLKEKLRITEASLEIDEQKRGFAVRTRIIDALEVGYGIDQYEDVGSLGATQTRHTIGTELHVTDSLSFEALRKFEESTATGTVDDLSEPQTEDKFLLKFRKNF